MVMQSAFLFPGTILENLGFGPSQRGERLPLERAEWLLERVGLSEYRDRGVGELSGGEAQRVSLARALANAPEVLLLDEPTAALDEMSAEQIKERLTEYATGLYERKEKDTGSGDMRLLERLVMLKTIDDLWKEHLTVMDHLRQQVGLHAMRQVDPLVIYKQEGHTMFQSLLAGITHDVAHTIFRVTIAKEGAPTQSPMAQAAKRKEAVAVGQKVGRNDPCPCGSGKKYKKCCGR